MENLGINSTNKTDELVETAKLQKDIEHYLGLDQTDLIFEYSRFEGKMRLDLITVNPKHNQSFLFHYTLGIDKIDALKKMMDYVKSYKESESSFTIQWTLKDSDALQTSYFRAENILRAIDKLYYGKDPNTITIFSVVLNPIS